MATRGEAFGARTVRVLRRAARPLASLSVRRIALFLAAVLVLFHVAYAAMNGTDHLREGSHDTLVKWRLSVPDPDPRIVVVDIDETSLARMAPEHGLWPWPRDTLATRTVTCVMSSESWSEPSPLASEAALTSACRIALVKSPWPSRSKLSCRPFEAAKTSTPARCARTRSSASALLGPERRC